MVAADIPCRMPDHPHGDTRGTPVDWYRRGLADGYAGRPRSAETSDWGHLDRYADGYEDGEFARYRHARDAETPLGLMRTGGRLRNDTARGSVYPPPGGGEGEAT